MQIHFQVKVDFNQWNYGSYLANASIHNVTIDLL